MTYGEILDTLNGIERINNAPSQVRRDDGFWRNVSNNDFKLLEKLGLLNK
jgi:hypothetical protein